ncbi:MAG: hypothetical protein ACUVXA_04655 [Candidatus Jordarchaeum sp.]|uniref:hypothetical protein n=1 Tax=Candidatus Jordarchaeum sp. TaxID=2823881 RepID=UPI00404A963E
MSEKKSWKSALTAPVKDKRVIGLMAVRGFGMFLLVTGMIGIAIILGPLNHLIGVEYHKIFGNVPLDLLLCFLLTVVGGAIEYVAEAFIKHLST